MRLKTFILLGFILVSKCVFSQGGGPPMITTDPGTPSYNHWEINTSLGYRYSNRVDIQLPAMEIVYGIGSHSQISVQLPLPNVELNSSHFTTMSQPQLGVKKQFVDEENGIISLAVYPQVVIPIYSGQKAQIFIPIEVEKTFGSFRIGEELGYFILNNPNTFFSGTIIGIKLKNDLELMAEFFFTKTLKKQDSTSGLLNFGFRKQIGKSIVVMSSIGTELVTPLDEDRQSLFGLFGVQILLGS